MGDEEFAWRTRSMADVARSEDAQHSRHSHGGHVKREAAVAAYGVVDDAMAVDVAAVVIGIVTTVAVIISAASLTVPSQSKPSFGGRMQRIEYRTLRGVRHAGLHLHELRRCG